MAGRGGKRMEDTKKVKTNIASKGLQAQTAKNKRGSRKERGKQKAAWTGSYSKKQQQSREIKTEKRGE